MKRLQPQSVKYFLTPSGIADKVERTYSYVLRTYNEINRLRNRLIQLAHAVTEEKGVELICFFGKREGLSDMIKGMISEEVFRVPCCYLSSIVALREALQGDRKTIVIVWESETKKELDLEKIQCVDIMNMLEI